MGGLTGSFLLDWAILAVSLFNTILLFWLGITIVLSAERRNLGVWLLGGGAFAGAIFFVSHTAILGQEIGLNFDGLNFWWRIGWTPIAVAPFAWYVVMLWFNGYWALPRTALYRRHRPLLMVMLVLASIFVMLFLTSNFVPSYDQVVQLDLSGVLALGDVPLLLIFFPVFMVICILLSIDVLRSPSSAQLGSRDPAHQHARPWLLAASVTLLVVSLVVTVFIAGVVNRADGDALVSLDVALIGVFDLGLSLLIASATLLMGQAMVTYEVFTGRSLPRRGFMHHWRNIVLIASGYGVVVGWSLAAHLRPVYSLLLTTLLMVAFYALYSWRSFAERERFMRQLRPFVSTPDRSAQLLVGDHDSGRRSLALLEAICAMVLGTDRAQVIPLGVVSTLVSERLIYPHTDDPALIAPPPGLSTHPQPIDPTVYTGYCWAIPLWSERGLIGCLFVGSKQGSGIYAQEEIEIAQAGGERILDMLAGEAMTQALVDLQRHRLTQARVIDLRTRRALHDDVLPIIHTTILELSSAAREQPAVQQAQASLTAIHRQIADLIRDIPGTAVEEGGPRDLSQMLRKMLEAEFGGAFDSIEWDGDVVLVAGALEGEIIAGAVREAARNAAVHARGTDKNRPLHLSVTICKQDVVSIHIQDDGVGLGGARRSASGSGLRLHSTLLTLIGGSLIVATANGGGTLVEIRLPSGLSEGT